MRTLRVFYFGGIVLGISKEEQQKFLNSEEWAKIRADLFTIRGKCCEVCGSTTRIQVHHLTYARYGGNEDPGDLIVLCRTHHMEAHGIKPKRKRKQPRKKKAIKPEQKLATPKGDVNIKALLLALTQGGYGKASTYIRAMNGLGPIKGKARQKKYVETFFMRYGDGVENFRPVGS